MGEAAVVMGATQSSTEKTVLQVPDAGAMCKQKCFRSQSHQSEKVCEDGEVPSWSQRDRSWSPSRWQVHLILLCGLTKKPEAAASGP